MAVLLNVLVSTVSAPDSLVSGGLQWTTPCFMLCLGTKAKQQSALNSLASSPYMFVTNSQVETGSRIQSEEPIQ